MLAAAALGALGAQLAEIRAVKADWFVGAGRVDQLISAPPLTVSWATSLSSRCRAA